VKSFCEPSDFCREACGSTATTSAVQACEQRVVWSRGEHGQDQDWISCRILAIFWIRIGFGQPFLKKIGSGQDQDICLISITKFP